MLDLGSRPVGSLEQHDIKPTGSISQVVPRQILSRQANQFFLLLPVHGMDRPPEILRPSRLHLDEHQHRSVFGNQIQFTERGAKVFGDNPIAFTAQVALCRRLTFLPKESSRVKNSHAIGHWVSHRVAVAG